jgi:hypothetical protein
VLLMICVNIPNLLFVRVPGRLREAGIRKAMGASESRLIQPGRGASTIMTASIPRVGVDIGFDLLDAKLERLARTLAQNQAVPHR